MAIRKRDKDEVLLLPTALVGLSIYDDLAK